MLVTPKLYPRGRRVDQFFQGAEGRTGPACVVTADVFRRTADDDFSALDTALRSDVDHVVGIFDDVEVMFDHDHHVAGIHQAMQDTDQTLDVREVESGCGLIEQEARFFSLTDQLGGQL